MKKMDLIYTSCLYDFVCSYADNDSNDKYKSGFANFRAELADINSQTESELNDDIVFESANFYKAEEFNDTLNYLDHITDNANCVTYGTLGLWNGTHEIYPVRAECVSEAIRRTANDADDIEIYRKNGHLYVVSKHHDGNNKFTISILNEKGEMAGDNANLSKRCYHKAIDWKKW